MAALTAATTRATRNHGAAPVDLTVGTGATIYAGALVAINTSTGRAVAASAAASRKFAGLAEETKTGDTSGTVRCRVRYDCEALINAATALTKAYIGSNAAVSTDNDATTMSGAGTAGVRVRIGEIVEIESGDVWVRLRNDASEDV